MVGLGELSWAWVMELVILGIIGLVRNRAGLG